MQINSIIFKNIASYGNEEQRIDFNAEHSSFYLVTGGNGFGKCLHPDTNINIKINDKELEKKFKQFLKEKHMPYPF